ncbi:MAG TPA: signal peptidase II [Opitutaceae bacterium]|nr:signal peptidase II [Opitutaceae bacterium]
MPDSPSPAGPDEATAAGSSPARAASPDFAPRPSYLVRFLAYTRLWALAALVVALDQFTKALVVARLPFGTYGSEQTAVIPGFFYLAHVGNTGGAWSIFAGRSLPLALVGIAVLVAVFIWRKHLGLRERFVQWCFGLFVGGSVGNIIDRLWHGHVVDFLDFRFGAYVFPTFNVADSAICVGVFAYVIWSLKQPAPPG